MNTIALVYNVSIWKWTQLSSSFTPLSNNDELGKVIPNCYLIIKNGYIHDINSYDDNLLDMILSMYSYDAIINGNQRLVLPGLIDSHIHISLLGESQYYVNLSDCYSIEMMSKKLCMHNEMYPHLSWIIGVNWDQEKLQVFPNRNHLDETNISKPIFLWRACWHIGVANSIALEMINVLNYDDIHHTYHSTNQKCPEGGVIEYDPQTKLPTGILKERATELIVSTQQQIANSIEGKQQKLRFLQEGMQLCVDSGLTSVQTNDEGCLKAYQNLQEKDLIPLRIFLTPSQDEIYRNIDNNGIKNIKPFRPIALTNILRISLIKEDCCYNAVDSSSRLVMERVKLFSDGSLGAKTAAIRVINPHQYENKDQDNIKNIVEYDHNNTTDITTTTATTNNANTTDTTSNTVSSLVNSDGVNINKTIYGMTGILINTDEDLTRKIFDSYISGYRLEIHAIGDAAAAHVLDCLDQSEEQINQYYQSKNINESISVNNNNDNNSSSNNSNITRSNNDNIIINNNSSADSVLNYPDQYKYQYYHRRPILTHCQVLGSDIIENMNKKGVIANIQPSFVPTDMNWIESRVSEEQLQYSYIWKTLFNQAITANMMNMNNCEATDMRHLYVAGGSDAPIETPNPFTGMYDAIYRTNKHKLSKANGAIEEVFLPRECLSFSQALWIYTIGGAIASECEHILGQVEVGYIGDIILVNPDIILDSNNNTKLKDILYNYKPELVLIGGKVEFINKHTKNSIQVLYKSTSLQLHNNNNNNNNTNSKQQLDLSDSIYIPGKGGNGKSYHSSQSMIERSQYCIDSFQCACILRGKHCMKSY